MKKIFFIFLFLFPVFLNPSSGENNSKNIPTLQILILNSYHKGFQWTDRIVSSIEKFYSEHGVSAEFHVEYMDTKRCLSNQYLELLYNTYRMKYSKSEFDCIISTDDDALNFLVKYRRSLFKNSPVVFAGINNQSIPDTIDRKSFTGIMEEDSPGKTMRLIRKLHPDLKKIYVICDYSTTGRARFDALREVEQKFSDISFVYSKNTTLDSILGEVRSLDPEIPVLLLSLFSDSTGRNFSYSEVMSELGPAVRGPVYSITIHYLGLGIVGGVLNSPEKQGTEAASLSIRIIKGEKPENINIIKDPENRAVIDYKVAVKSGVDMSRIPDDTVLINKPYSFYEFYLMNRTVLLSILSVFLLVIVAILTVSITIVMRINKKRKKLLEELSRALIEVKTLSGLLPICSSCKKIRDDSGYWSQIEQYLEQHSNAEFTHSLCPDCAKRLYPDIFDDETS